MLKNIRKAKEMKEGTSFHDGYIKTTYNKLVELFGEPEYKDESGSDKVSCEWELEFDDEEKTIQFTIYDWKEYGNAPAMEGNENTIFNFHIGTYNEELTKEVVKKLKPIFNRDVYQTDIFGNIL